MIEGEGGESRILDDIGVVPDFHMCIMPELID